MNRLHRWYCKTGHWKRAVTDEILPWALDGIALGEAVLEIGPGHGLTTDWLRQRVKALDCLEIDEALADSLRDRFVESNVMVQHGDASAIGGVP